MIEIKKIDNKEKFCEKNKWDKIEGELLKQINNTMKYKKGSNKYCTGIAIENIYKFSFDYSKEVKTKVQQNGGGSKIDISISGHVCEGKLKPLPRDILIIIEGGCSRTKLDPNFENAIKEVVTGGVKSYIHSRAFINKPLIKEIAEQLGISSKKLARGPAACSGL